MVPFSSCHFHLDGVVAVGRCVLLLWFQQVVTGLYCSDERLCAGDAYAVSVFPQPWRTRWPWEQAQLYSIHAAFNESIFLLSFPHLPHLPWTSTKRPRSQYPTDPVRPWCFSHWPGADCFLTHHCASLNQKKKMKQLFWLPNSSISLQPKCITFD